MEFKDLISQALSIKAKYKVLNRTEGGREWGVNEYLQGFMGDVGDLSKLVMAKQGFRFDQKDVDEALAHELADCLYAVIAIAEELDIDVEKAFIKTMSRLEQKISEKTVPKRRTVV